MKIFTRTEQYKLYKSGAFYDVSKDVLEQQPLEVSGLGEVAMVAHAQLQQALAGFEVLEQRHKEVYPDKERGAK